MTGGESLARLSADAVELYRKTVETGFLPEAPSAADGLSPESSARSALSELLAAGLLRQRLEEPGYSPVDPELAAEGHERRAAQALVEATTLRSNWSSLTTAYRASRSWHDPSSLVRFVEGLEAIGQHLTLVYQDQSLKMIRTVQPGGPRPPEVLERTLPDELALLRRGVQRQILYQDPARQHPATQQFVQAITEAGAEVRTLPFLMDRCFLFDGLAVYSFDGDNKVAVFSREPSTVALLQRQFAQQWDVAKPFSAARSTGTAGTQLSYDQRKVLRLVCESGMTTESAASALGWSRRTVDRLLAAARELYGNAPSNTALAFRLRGEYPNGLPTDW